MKYIIGIGLILSSAGMCLSLNKADQPFWIATGAVILAAGGIFLIVNKIMNGKSNT